MSLSLERQNAYREAYRAAHPGWRPATEVYEGAIRTWLNGSTRVIDVGCGRGGVLEQIGPAATAPVGFDPDPASLREHRLPTLRRAQALADHLPLAAACADMVIAAWVLEHLENPARTFAEIGRVLRPGGAFIFLTPDGRSLPALLNQGLRPLQKVLVPRLYGRAEADTFPVRYRANRPDQVRRLAAGAGLRVAALHQIPDPTYLAFTPLLFRVSSALARVTPPVHLVGVLVKEPHPPAPSPT